MLLQLYAEKYCKGRRNRKWQIKGRPTPKEALNSNTSKGNNAEEHHKEFGRGEADDKHYCPNSDAEEFHNDISRGEVDNEHAWFNNTKELHRDSDARGEGVTWSWQQDCEQPCGTNWCGAEHIWYQSELQQRVARAGADTTRRAHPAGAAPSQQEQQEQVEDNDCTNRLIQDIRNTQYRSMLANRRVLRRSTRSRWSGNGATKHSCAGEDIRNASLGRRREDVQNPGEVDGIEELYDLDGKIGLADCTAPIEHTANISTSLPCTSAPTSSTSQAPSCTSSSSIRSLSIARPPGDSSELSEISIISIEDCETHSCNDFSLSIVAPTSIVRSNAKQKGLTRRRDLVEHSIFHML